MIDFSRALEIFGDGGTAALVGAALGLAFGFLAQRSRFCARSAVLEAARGEAGTAMLVWLSALGAGTLAVSMALMYGGIDQQSVQLLANPSSLSGAIVGGLLFGAGMVLARGCASRQLVLAATGNLRAWVGFGLFALVALATISGPLAPARQAVGSLWTIGPQSSDIAALAGAGPIAVVAVSGALLAGVVAVAFSRGISPLKVAAGGAIGVVIAAGWVLTTALSGQTFEPTQVESLAFTGPAAQTLSFLAAPLSQAMSFDIGLVPAVFVGALVAALASGEFKLQWFASVKASGRYLAGAVLMGFGGVLAVGCTVGALGNLMLMVTSSWIAIGAMAIGAVAAHLTVDAPRGAPAAPVVDSARLTVSGAVAG